MSTNFHPKFEEGLYYHVYNRTNNEELLFRSDENFNYFLTRYEYYIKDFIETIAYCLMPTHFHFLVKVKNNISVKERHDISVPKYLEASGKRSVMSCSFLVEEQFRKFFISYSKSYNKWCDRHGNLLQRPFKRVLLENEKKVIDWKNLLYPS